MCSEVRGVYTPLGGSVGPITYCINVGPTAKLFWTVDNGDDMSSMLTGLFLQLTKAWGKNLSG